MGVFNRIFAQLAGKSGTPDRLMIDATDLKAHRYGSQPAKKGDIPRRIGRTKGSLNSKLHAVCDGNDRPVAMLLSEGQMSDCKGTVLLLSALLEAKELLVDRGYGAGWFRTALTEKGIMPCILSKKNRKIQIEYGRERYFINNGIRLKTCSANSKIGSVLPCVMTAAPTPRNVMNFQGAL